MVFGAWWRALRWGWDSPLPAAGGRKSRHHLDHRRLCPGFRHPFADPRDPSPKLESIRDDAATHVDALKSPGKETLLQEGF